MSTENGRRRRRLALTHRLVDESIMRTSLVRLLAGTDTAFFCVTRGKINPDTGQEQPSAVIVEGEDMIDSTGKLSDTLRRSRKVVLVAAWPDGSSVMVDLTARALHVLTRTDQLVSFLREFSAQLRTGGRTRLITPRVVPVLVLLPLIWFPIYFLATDLDPVAQKYYSEDDPDLPEFSPWVDNALDIVRDAIWLAWPATLAAALIIFLIRKLSGGLRIWPGYMTQVKLLGLLYRLRNEGARSENWRQWSIGVAIAVTSSVLTFWFAR